MSVKVTPAYLKAFNQLNDEQKLAVTTIDGSVLVIAGPGTGKTQLLATRVGRILTNTDNAPEDILCLTFSDAAARTMQNRLADMIGSSAYSVTISTYHSFGSDLILRYPDLFDQPEDTKPADDLRINQIIRAISQKLDYSNPLKSDFYTKDIRSLISNYKRALITPEMLIEICRDNESFINQASTLVNQHLKAGERISNKQLAGFQAILAASHDLPSSLPSDITPLKKLWLESLQLAVNDAIETKKMSEISKWKKKWLEIGINGKWLVISPRIIKRQLALAEIYNLYNHELVKQKVYDYDDMIIQAINGLEKNKDIKLSLQERYQYILLDEFQDTNEAQFKMIELLTDNPVNEDRPNILAVGDDDQAIYRFQGAHYSHMQRFYDKYRDVLLVSLRINYRSSPGIINLSTAIRQQINDRLAIGDKQAIAINPQSFEDIKRVELPLDVEHLAWSADYIKSLINDGADPSTIAVLAPEHSLLNAFIPYLHNLGIPLSYERKDNILDDELIKQLLTMAELVVLLSSKDLKANSLWPIVLSYSHWQLPTSLIWEISWQACDERKSWIELLLDNTTTKPIALFFIKLSQIVSYTSFELMLNYLIGSQPLALNELATKQFNSPFYNCYFSGLAKQTEIINASEWQLLGQLTTLRNKLKSSSEEGLNLAQFVSLIDDYRKADLKIVDQSPYQESLNALNLMTAFAAKGREFKTVILLNLVDKTWGSSGRNRSSKISLPANLKHVRLDNNASDERLRLLFVAVSRARERLVMVSYKEELAGKEVSRLQYLEETEQDDSLQSPLLPVESQQVLRPKAVFSNPDLVKLSWYNKHLQIFEPEPKALLEDRLKKFRLSASNLNSFSDVSRGGPSHFYVDSILKFPNAPSISSLFGSTYHGTLDWHFKQTKKLGRSPELAEVYIEFEKRLRKRQLAKQDFNLLLKRGIASLAAYLKQTKIIDSPTDLSEQTLEANYLGARLVGEIDRLLVNEKTRTLHIVDFKTGKSYEKFKNEIKPFHHARQLYFYKLLIDLNPRFKGYKVAGATIQFVEPDTDSGLITNLELTFNEAEEERLKTLIPCVWNKIMSLDFPDTELYSENYSGIKKFEDSLINNSLL